MSDEIMLVFGEDGVAQKYDDTWDITIHCESEEEQKAVLEKLNNSNQEAQELSKNSPKLDKENGDLQPTCNQLATDCISRQAAIDALRESRLARNPVYMTTAMQVIEKLPSAKPEIEERTEEFAQNVPKEDLISRKAAIDAECEVCQIAPKKERGHNCTYYVHGCKEIECLRELPSAQPEPQWIPVSERLPEVGKDVMVCYDFKGHRSVLIGVLYGDEKFHGYDDEYLTPEGRKYRKAVAWMPLPEPYRAERRTDE